jgi:hypothetical protein
MDGGVSGEPVRASTENVEKDLVSAWYDSVDSDGFPLSAETLNRYSRLLQPKGIDICSWRTEKGFLRYAEILS